MKSFTKFNIRDEPLKCSSKRSYTLTVLVRLNRSEKISFSIFLPSIYIFNMALSYTPVDKVLNSCNQTSEYLHNSIGFHNDLKRATN